MSKEKDGGYGKDGETDSPYTLRIVPFDPEELKRFRIQTVQPVAFDPGTLRKALQRLAFQTRGFSWSRKRRVFPDAAVKVLAPPFLKKFARAGDGERIEYTVRSRSGRILVRGDTFQAVDGLHWRITVLNHSRRPIDDFSLSGESWRLVPLAGQAYKKRQVTRTVGQDLTNWIIFPHVQPRRLKAPHPRARDEKPPPSPPPSPSRPEIRTKLKFLEELKQEGLIEEEEYRIKKKELLEHF